MKYNYFGAMLDMSRNAVMKVEQVKKYIDCLSKMGYNMLQLYTEDTYELDGEPYFGYLRGRYTAKEIRELDAYAKEKGIELIPCVQTLGHMTALVRHSTYQPFVDTDDILLVGDERTYTLIDKIFAFLKDNFTTRKVNIGFDEAHMVGLGKYLDKHGYENRFDILIKHLRKVVEIANKYGFKCHMWSDMFFRLAFKENYDNDSPDESKHFPTCVPDTAGDGYYVDRVIDFSKELLDAVPKEIELTYWDYYNVEKKVYDAMFESHKKFNRELWFAGGTWTSRGFAPFNRYALKASKIAMQSVIERGCKNVLICAWGDGGKECSYFTVLPVLYAIRQFADGNFDEEKIAKGFKELFGMDYNDFKSMELANGEKIYLGRNGDENPQNPCKSLLYNDPFLSLMDKVVEEEFDIPYSKYASHFKKLAEESGEYQYLYNFYYTLCDLLSVKATLGVRGRKLYRSNDKEGLAEIIKDYDKTIQLLEKFYQSFKTLWHTENKPNGFEVHEIRLGGLSLRLRSCKEKIQDFIDGKIDVIEELDEEILSENPASHFHCIKYQHLASFGLLTD